MARFSRSGQHAVVLLDVGDDVLEQLVREPLLGGLHRGDALGGGRRAGREPGKVRRAGQAAVGHHHDHRPGLLLRQQVVEDEAGAADRAPARVLVAAAVQEVEDGVLRVAAVVARRRVDVHAPLRVERARVIPGHADLAVGNVAVGLERGLLARHHEHAVQAGDALLDHRRSWGRRVRTPSTVNV